MQPTDERYSKVPEIEQALTSGASLWEQLGNNLPGHADADGAAAAHEKIYRSEAAWKLITNHEAVLRDLVNPSLTNNIIQNPLTQSELQRVPTGEAMVADQFLVCACAQPLMELIFAVLKMSSLGTERSGAPAAWPCARH